MKSKIMKIKDEKLQYDINREAAEISALINMEKLINMNIFPVKKYYHLIKVE